MKRRTLLLCVPALAIASQAPAAAAVEIGDVVNGREVMDVCETCSKPLFEGDLVFSYSDGPTFCATHAPTWNDLKDMQDEAIAGGFWLESFDEPEHAQDARESVLAHIAAGKGAELYVWPL